jgi:hypothetical protein
VAEDPQWELAIVQSVYEFYRKLLHDSMQELVPLPSNLHFISLGELDQHFPDPLARIQGWLKLLDLAVTPSMLRQSLTPGVDPETAETLLRYYARKKGSNDVDRDKADFVATFLYRNPRVPGQWDRSGYTLDGVVPIPPFEIALIEILADAEPPKMPEECVLLLREFDALRHEVESYTSLEALTDSGLVQRGRDLKQALGAYFYHPGVLGVIGPYNAAVGQKLEELFRATTEQLKSFAEAVRREGGDVTSQVEGKVTVQHLALIEEGEILKAEYAAAQEKFRRVSKVKRAVDLRKVVPKRPESPTSQCDAQTALESKTPLTKAMAAAVASTRPTQMTAIAVTPIAQGAADGAVSTPAPPQPAPKWPPERPQAQNSPPRLPLHGFIGQADALEPVKVYDTQIEEGKLRSVEDSIRIFVRAADSKSRQVVPMSFFNLTLSAAEADACGAEYWAEKTFRGEYVRALSRAVALIARTSTELEELKQRRNSAHLWKPHASSLRFLLDVSHTTFEENNSVLAVAAQRGLKEKISAAKETLEKLRTRLDTAEQLLAELAARDSSSARS